MGLQAAWRDRNPTLGFLACERMGPLTAVEDNMSELSILTQGHLRVDLSTSPNPKPVKERHVD